MNLFCCLFPVLFTLEFVLTDPIIDVDVTTTTTTTTPQYTYTADTDSKQLVYRCISGGTSDGLVWRYNNVDYTNTLNAYQFYGVVRRIGLYRIDCYSGTSNVGSMDLTIRDSANMTAEYSGQRELYSSSPSGDYYTVTIPVYTTDIVITCEISRGFLYAPNTGFSSITTNPSVTFTLTNISGSGEYSCLRDIDGVSFSVLALNIVTGDAVTTSIVATSPTTTTTTTTITSMTTPTTTTEATTTAGASIQQTFKTTPTTTPKTTTTTTTTQTTQTTTTTVSTELFYTPDYDNLFVGFDDVTLTCVVITDSVQMLNVTLIDASTEHILQSQFGNYATVVMYHNLELQTGTMSYRCRVVTERGVVKQDTVTVRIRDIYTQEVTNLQTETETETGGVRLSWDTTHPLLANESFLLSVYDVSTGEREVMTTQRLKYSLTHLSHSHSYSIRIQVVNRLNNTHNYTQISYTYTEVTTSTQINIVVYSVAGMLLFIVLLSVISTIVGCSRILVRNVLKSKKTNKYKYTKSLEDTTPSANTPSNRREYISLSDVHTGTRLPQTHGYEPMTSVYPPQREYVPLEVTTPPNYCEIPESHFESENDNRQYENLSNVNSS